MTTSSHPETAPTDRRLTLLLNGLQSLVVQGVLLAELLAEKLMVQTIAVDSLEHAHKVLLAIYGCVSTPAHEALKVSAYMLEHPGPYVHLCVETVDGDWLDETVDDPDQIDALKAIGLWP